MFEIKFRGRDLDPVQFDDTEFNFNSNLRSKLDELSVVAEFSCKREQIEPTFTSEAVFVDSMNKISRDVFCNLSNLPKQRITEHKVANVMKTLMLIMQENGWNQEFPESYRAILNRTRSLRRGFVDMDDLMNRVNGA